MGPSGDSGGAPVPADAVRKPPLCIPATRRKEQHPCEVMGDNTSHDSTSLRVRDVHVVEKDEMGTDATDAHCETLSTLEWEHQDEWTPQDGEQ